MAESFVPLSLVAMSGSFAGSVHSSALGPALTLSAVSVQGHSVVSWCCSRRPAGLEGVVLVAPAPPAPVGMATPEFQEALAHAYDNAETIGQSIDLVLTYGELSAEAHRRVLEDSSWAEEAARTAWPRQALVEDFADRPVRSTCWCWPASTTRWTFRGPCATTCCP
ncbi:hypothetical protein [Streptomyces avermitilis]|uniref:hypothetical protein n=1 Tax=Streptomyces avermitilis TaxID=33903 RepID=UPI003817347B